MFRLYLAFDQALAQFTYLKVFLSHLQNILTDFHYFGIIIYHVTLRVPMFATG